MVFGLSSHARCGASAIICHRGKVTTVEHVLHLWLRLGRTARVLHFGVEPLPDNVYGITLLFRAQLAAFRNPVPLFQATSAAGRSGMLSDEDRMTAPRSLLPVFCRNRRSQPCFNEL